MTLVEHLFEENTIRQLRNTLRCFAWGLVLAVGAILGAIYGLDDIWHAKLWHIFLASSAGAVMAGATFAVISNFIPAMYMEAEPITVRQV